MFALQRLQAAWLQAEKTFGELADLIIDAEKEAAKVLPVVRDAAPIISLMNPALGAGVLAVSEAGIAILDNTSVVTTAVSTPDTTPIGATSDNPSLVSNAAISSGLSLTQSILSEPIASLSAISSGLSNATTIVGTLGNIGIGVGAVSVDLKKASDLIAPIEGVVEEIENV